eukprot:m51a1_g8266 putative serine threonine kinase (1615) ;mRNA; r:28556-34364
MQSTLSIPRPVAALLLVLCGLACAAVPWTCTPTVRLKDYDYNGGNYLTGRASTSVDHCEALCCATPSCNTWVFVDNMCWMKSSTGGGRVLLTSWAGVVVKDYGPRNLSRVEYQGCWADRSDSRDLPLWPSSDLSASQCVETCASIPSPFSGSEWYSECHCGDTYGRHGASTACTTPCDANVNETCGGAGALSVWSTGYELIDFEACLPQPFFAQNPVNIALDTNFATLSWSWNVTEWNPFCWGDYFRVVATSGSATKIDVSPTCTFHKSPVPATLSQSTLVPADVGPGVYNLSVTMVSVRPGDWSKEVSAQVCIPSAPTASPALLSPGDGNVSYADGGAVTFAWAAIAAGAWGTDTMCGAAVSRTYDVFIGRSSATLALAARVNGTIWTTSLPNGDYLWNVVPNNGARLAFGLVGDLVHAPRNLTVHAPVCGNDVREGGIEQCDGGAGCSANCTCRNGYYPTSPPSAGCATRCGDGIARGLEDCDNGTHCQDCACEAGYYATWPASQGCESWCGDHIVSGDEECDGGEGCELCSCLAGFYAASPPNRSCETRCNDSVAAGREQCDGGLGCGGDCTCAPGFYAHDPATASCYTVCGDSVVAGAEQCEGSGAGCHGCNCTAGFYPRSPVASSCATLCGDGIVVGAEECDNPGSPACQSNCTCPAGYTKATPAASQNCSRVVDPCARFLTCRTCLGAGSCGWCGNSSLCISSATGLQPQTCPRLWAFEACPEADAATGADSATPVGAIVGGVVGGAAAVGVVAALVVLALVRQSRSGQSPVSVRPSCTEFMVNAMEIKLGAIIGRGSYGVVHKAFWKGTEVAAKVMLADNLSEENVEQFDQEVSVMRSLRHPNVLLFMCYAKSDKDLVIVTEFMPNGSMMDILLDKARPLPLKTRLAMLHDVCKGMAYLHYHEPQIVHCDLKSSNVLVDSSMNAKVCDFGLTVFLEKDRGDASSNSKSRDSAIGSLFWTAPEVLSGAPCTTKSDVFSFGVIIWETITRATPYDEMNPHYVAQKVLESALRPTISVNFPRPLQSLMEQCWNANPLVRPEFPEIVSEWSGIVDQLESAIKADDAQKVYIEPPSGMLALVFTDIQGSTHLWEWNAALMKKALHRHNDIMREVLRKHNGYEVKTEGDAFMIAFQSPPDALRFCCAAQLALLAETWDVQLMTQECCAEVQRDGKTVFRGLRVRMGIHVGIPEVETGERGAVDYLGPCVNKAARVASLAFGGQVILSSSARTELERVLVNYGDLGQFEEIGPVTLKGIPGEEIVHNFVLKEAVRTFVRITKVPSFGTSTDLVAFGEAPAAEDSVASSPHLTLAPPGATGSGSRAQRVGVPDGYQDLLDRFTKQDKPKWAVRPDEVTISSEQIGRGNFGSVFKGEWKGQTVVVKKFYQQKVDKVTLAELERQLKEISILTELRHPSIVLFMGACLEPNDMFIITEWMDMGSLREVLSAQKIESPVGIQILSSVCQGMTYLHMTNIVHRDLKSSNILLNKKWDVKLSDFGLAAIKSTSKTMTVCGTVAWMAPEVLVSSDYSEKSDVYGFAMVMYEILTRHYPFLGTQVMALVPKIVGGQRPMVPADLAGYCADYVALMKLCWAPAPQDRPGFREIGGALHAIAEK